MRNEDICVSVKPAARMIPCMPDVLENPGATQHIRCLPMMFSSVVNQHKKYTASVKPTPHPKCPVCYQDFIYSCPCENHEKQPDGSENSVRCQNHFRRRCRFGYCSYFKEAFTAEATSRPNTITATDLKENVKLHEIYNSKWLQRFLSSCRDNRADLSSCY